MRAPSPRSGLTVVARPLCSAPGSAEANVNDDLEAVVPRRELIRPVRRRPRRSRRPAPRATARTSGRRTSREVTAFESRRLWAPNAPGALQRQHERGVVGDGDVIGAELGPALLAVDRAGG